MPDILALEHSLKLLTNWNIFLLIVAGLAAMAIGVLSVLIDKASDKLIEAKDTETKFRIAAVDAEAKTRIDAARSESGERIAELNKQSIALRGDLTAKQAELETAQQKTASIQKEAAEAQLSLRNAVELAATPRRIIMQARNGDEKIRAVKFKALEQFTNTQTVIIFVSYDDEATTLAYDIQAALHQAGWKSITVVDLRSTSIPLGYITDGVQIRTLLNLDSVPHGESAKPPAVAQALYDLLQLDLGKEVTGASFGVKWQPDVSIEAGPMGLAAPKELLSAEGLLITVGHKPTWDIFWSLNAPQRAQESLKTK